MTDIEDSTKRRTEPTPLRIAEKPDFVPPLKLQKIDADEAIIGESDRDQLKIRKDCYGNLILKGSKKHKISFQDKTLFKIQYFEMTEDLQHDQFKQKCCSIQ